MNVLYFWLNWKHSENCLNIITLFFFYFSSSSFSLFLFLSHFPFWRKDNRLNEIVFPCKRVSSYSSISKFKELKNCHKIFYKLYTTKTIEISSSFTIMHLAVTAGGCDFWATSTTVNLGLWMVHGDKHRNNATFVNDIYLSNVKRRERFTSMLLALHLIPSQLFQQSKCI